VLSKNIAQVSSADLTEYQCLLCLQGSHTVWKVLNLKSGFQDLEKVLNLAKICIRYWKSLEIPIVKKSEVFEQNLTEGKALHYLCSVMQCAKLSSVIKKFEKWREAMVLNFLKLVSKRWKSMENDFWNCVGTLCLLRDHIRFWLVFETSLIQSKRCLMCQVEQYAANNVVILIIPFPVA